MAKVTAGTAIFELSQKLRWPSPYRVTIDSDEVDTLGVGARRGIVSFFERLKTEASAEWRAYTEHPFTEGLADGSLTEAAFRHYLIQDYLFLIEFARAYALAVYKSPRLADMREAAAGLSAILDVEMNLHVKLCAGWGLSPAISNEPLRRSRCWPIHATCSMLGCAAICWRSRWRWPPA
jgi:pyrroloquinoline quinone (PQQ) biosynthesis protein C